MQKIACGFVVAREKWLRSYKKRLVEIEIKGRVMKRSI